MSKTKIIAMYLPQFHETEDNNRWWGKGFTDWTSVKSAESLFDGHNQPEIPLNDNYYDLTDKDTIKWQMDLAKANGIYGFGIYHYWFSSDKQTLTRPAEIILENKELDLPFLFAWDNNSWVRTWSKYKHNTNAWSPRSDASSEETHFGDGVLAKLDYGDESDWKIHFDYLNKFFKDDRYIKKDGKPVFIIWNYTDKLRLAEMIRYWRKLAIEAGYPGLYLINRTNPYDGMDGFDCLFNYEPMFSAWQNYTLIKRVYQKFADIFVKNKSLTIYDYDKIWNKILKFAGGCAGKDVMFGGFVSYDDTPRRGRSGKIVLGGTPERFTHYLSKLMDISEEQKREYLFVTAWNEWGEGAHLEPDVKNRYSYLEAVKAVVEER